MKNSFQNGPGVIARQGGGQQQTYTPYNSQTQPAQMPQPQQQTFVRPVAQQPMQQSVPQPITAQPMNNGRAAVQIARGMNDNVESMGWNTQGQSMVQPVIQPVQVPTEPVYSQEVGNGAVPEGFQEVEECAGEVKDGYSQQEFALMMKLILSMQPRNNFSRVETAKKELDELKALFPGHMAALEQDWFE